MAAGFEILVTPFFVVHWAYNYVLAAVGLALLVDMLVNAGYSYQRQAVGLLVAFSPPIIGNVLYNVFDHGFTTDQEGTGFGLSIVRDIVEVHGWTVTVTDGSDGGARFEVTTERQTS